MNRRSSLHNVLAMLLGLALLFGALGSGSSRATTTFTVNTTADGVDFAPGNGICATDATGQFCSLRAAIMETNALAGADTIILPAGTYTLSIAQQTFAVQDAGPGESNGDLDINDDLTIRGAGAATTIIAGGAEFNDRIVDVQPNRTVYLAGVTIRNGVTLGDSGGGIDNEGNLMIIDSVITGNRSRVLAGPSASGGNAAGIRNAGPLTIRNSTISNNQAEDDGGALFNTGAPVSLINVTISGNTATGDGAGIVNSDGATAGTITIDSSTIAFNASTDGNGGGLRNRSGTVRFHNTIVAHNTSKPSVSAPNGRNCSSSGTLVSEGYNVEAASSCEFTTASDRFGIDPQLGPLQDNGGPTPTHALAAGSIAVDAGDPARCQASDQRGRNRAADGNDDGQARCDIGAYELNGLALGEHVYLPVVITGN